MRGLPSCWHWPLWLLLATAPVLAHEVRPAYLELNQLDADNYDVLWKVPARGERRLALYVRLPGDCTGTEPGARLVGGAHIERWRVTCPGGLGGSEIAIEGLAATRTDVLARVQRVDGTSQTARLTPDATAFTVGLAPTFQGQVRAYTTLGIEHILLGIDHLLFVLGLLWLVRGAWALVKTITAFTVAHSITLAAATFGWIRLPVAPVEAAIALSIVFVAVEAVKLRRGDIGLAARFPWLIAFGFGLLHGLGFATALERIGIPEAEIPLALLFFNVGVEIGQLGFVLVVLTAVHALGRLQLRLPGFANAAALYLVGSVAAYWFVDRTLAMV
jgi:hypothetical protein